MKNKKKSVMLSSDDEEIAEYEPDLLVQDEEVSSSAVSQATGKRGRPPIPEKWTQLAMYWNWRIIMLAIDHGMVVPYGRGQTIKWKA